MVIIVFFSNFQETQKRLGFYIESSLILNFEWILNLTSVFRSRFAFQNKRNCNFVEDYNLLKALRTSFS